jgi:hypothetical protein
MDPGQDRHTQTLHLSLHSEPATRHVMSASDAKVVVTGSYQNVVLVGGTNATVCMSGTAKLPSRGDISLKSKRV